MSGATPQPLLNAREAFAAIRELAQLIEGAPRVESAVLRSRTGRIRELLDVIDGQLDELAELAFEGLLDGEYRTIATCADCLVLRRARPQPYRRSAALRRVQAVRDQRDSQRMTS